jgi:m7GpppX diphosphatase
MLMEQLELSDPAPGPSLLARMTYTYVLGVEHGLYPGLSGQGTD